MALNTEGMTCAFPGCHVKLNMTKSVYRDGREEVRWVHGIPPEDVPFHEPVPIPSIELNSTLICDFCGDLNPEWLLGCPAYEETFMRIDDDSEHFAVKREEDGWAACASCKELLDQGDIRSVTDRAVAASELRGHLSRMSRAERRSQRSGLWKAIHEAHKNFAKMRTGQDWLLIDGIDKQRQLAALKELFEP